MHSGEIMEIAVCMSGGRGEPGTAAEALTRRCRFNNYGFMVCGECLGVSLLQFRLLETNALDKEEFSAYITRT